MKYCPLDRKENVNPELPMQIAVGALLPAARVAVLLSKGGRQTKGQRIRQRSKLDYTLETIGVCAEVVRDVVLAFYVFLAPPLQQALPWMFFSLPDWMRWSGLGVLVAGILLTAAARLQLKENWMKDVGLLKNHTLVTHGVYKWVRHPMYSGFWLTNIGLALVTCNSIVAVAGLLGVLAYTRRIYAEDQMLAREFPRAYREYFKRAGALWPRIIRRS